MSKISKEGIRWSWARNQMGKYVSAEDMKAEGPIPTAPVQKADRPPRFKGDDLSKFPVEIDCGFQEN